MSRIGKKPVTVPSGVTATVEGQTVKMKGPKGQLQFVVHDDVEVKFENGTVKVHPRFGNQPRAGAVRHRARAGCQSGRRRHQGFREEARDHRRRLSRRAAGQEPAARARLQPRRRLCDPGGHRDHGSEADRDRHHRQRCTARRPGRCRDPQLPSAGALQGQGREVFR